MPLVISYLDMLLEPLLSQATQQPNEIAIIDDHGSYTYPQLAAMVSGLGMYLSVQTEQPHVGLLLPAGVGFVASFYGTLAAGKSVVPINFLLGDREIAHIIADSGIDTVITIPQLASRLKEQRLNIVDLTQLPQPPPAAIAPRLPVRGPDDLAVLMYTSGTSGLPKGVMLTYGNISSDVDAAIEHVQLQGKHSFLGIVPLFHTTGMLATMLAPIRLGSHMVFMSRFSPVGTIKAIRERRLSVVVAVPSMYAAMVRLKHAGPEDVQSIYAAITGGEPLPESVREGWLKKFGKPLYEGYGLTETIGPVAFNTPEAHRPGSVGKLIPGATVRIVDDEGQAVPQGNLGELWLKGPMIMKGYYHLPDETAAALTADGFFRTGDLGKLDQDGFLYITGRKKEMIIVAGENVSPREIEDVLMRHPAVADAAVLGKKDPSRGEVVVAFVILKDGQHVASEALRDFCREQGMAQWKCPREVRIVTTLPRSPTGKVLKRVLAEQLTAQ